MYHQDYTPVTAPEPVLTEEMRRRFTIGLPRSCDPSERRFPLTPEVCAMLIESGFAIKMEEDAAQTIHFTDAQYTRVGVEVTRRSTTLQTDIVISLACLSAADVRTMRRGAMLLTLADAVCRSKESVDALLAQRIIAVAVDMMQNENGDSPFSDILSEISGHAAIARAASLLADAVHGKGILLGGVAGVNPCEVTVIGSDIAACAAAESALGVGSQVRMFDNDIYRLREASRRLSRSVVSSVLHPRVLANALRTSDVVIYAGLDEPFEISAEDVAMMKRGVVILDLTQGRGRFTPSLATVDLARDDVPVITASNFTRVCYINVANYVPRTSAMALSSTFLTMLRHLSTCEGMTNALRLLPGVRVATLTFLGKAVNADVARCAGVRHVDINIFLAMS